MNRAIRVLFIIMVIASPLLAQSNEYLDSLLEKENITLADAAYLVYLSGDSGFESRGPEGAAALLDEKYGVDGSAYTTARLFARICMDEFHLPRGILYATTGSPRYAFRDMKFLGLMQGIDYPNQTLTPEQVLRIISGSIEARGGRQ